MPAFLFSSAAAAVFNLIQLIAGCLPATVIYLVFQKRQPTAGKTTGSQLALIFLFSFCGIVLPFGIYGVIPIIASMIAVGFEGSTVFSLLIANVMFNMTIPFTDPGFVWRNGYRQVLLAFAAGFLAGLVLYILRSPVERFVRKINLPVLSGIPSNIRVFLALVDESIRKLGLFLIAGSIADILFQRYLLGNIVNAFYLTPFTASIPTFFGNHDVSNPLFLLTFIIVYMLMNLVNLSALLAILKWKGILCYFGYFVLWAVILAIPAFI